MSNTILVSESGRHPEVVCPVRSPLLRWTLVVLGTFFVALGVVGVFVPLMPTTVFIIMAAGCYARASPRFHRWLWEHRWFGPSLRAWSQHRSMPRRARKVALVSVVASFSLSVAVVPVWWVRLMLGAMGVALFVFLWRIPILEDLSTPL